MVARTMANLEKNVSLSFSYVKKDLLNLNDSISGLKEKIQHLSLNDAMLLERINRIEKLVAVKKEDSKQGKSKNGKLDFYDAKTKKKFSTDNYRIETKAGRKFAVAVSPSKTKAYRMLGAVKSKKAKIKKDVRKDKQQRTSVSRKKISKTPKKIVTETVLYE